ncbi:MAG TPA: IPT/TIG domain-containing protein, partial [Flavisolibacter sp.]|nr:IPT/TIG domain-containing protein [Flavisolibacter sp.]
VIALPTVATISTTDFEAGTTITITGNNLGDVSSVVIDGTTEQVTIVSKDRKTLVIRMPASNVNFAKLKITNSSGDRVTDQALTNMSKALKFFTEGFDQGMQDWSWSSEHLVSSTEAFMGTKSLRSVYSANSYGAISIHYDANIPFADYSFLTFWAKGGAKDLQLTVWPDPDNSKAKSVTIPANVWTYVKVPLADFKNAVTQRLNLQGMNTTDNITVHFDNILFIK